MYLVVRCCRGVSLRHPGVRSCRGVSLHASRCSVLPWSLRVSRCSVLPWGLRAARCSKAPIAPRGLLDRSEACVTLVIPAAAVGTQPRGSGILVQRTKPSAVCHSGTLHASLCQVTRIVTPVWLTCGHCSMDVLFFCGFRLLLFLENAVFWDVKPCDSCNKRT
jgi:hypothetical protein